MRTRFNDVGVRRQDIVWLLVLAGCSQSVPLGPTRSCNTAGDCFANEACVASICREFELHDAGAVDVGSQNDAETTDGTEADSPDADTDPIDSGVDAGSSGSIDFGFVDLGPLDEGPQTAPIDAGPPDTGIPPTAIDLTGMTISNAESATQVHTFAAGTALLPGQVLVLARDATRLAFETAHSINLGPSVVFVSAGASSRGAPIINGGETWTLAAADGSVLDGPTFPGNDSSSYQRRSLAAPDNPGSWIIAPDTQATPGATALPASGVGLVISEWSDASGTGRFAYEFIELYYAP